MQILVQCHAGYRGEETPRRMVLGARSIDVVDVLDRWLTPEHRYFKVRGDDGNVYTLRHDGRGGSWEFTVLERRRRPTRSR